MIGQVREGVPSKYPILIVQLQLVEEPNLKKCVIKGDNWNVKGPTKNLYIFNAEVVLITVWGGIFPNSPVIRCQK